MDTMVLVLIASSSRFSTTVSRPSFTSRLRALFSAARRTRRRALFAGVRPRALAGQLRRHHLVHQVLGDLDSVHVVGKREAPDLISFEIEYIDRRHTVGPRSAQFCAEAPNRAKLMGCLVF